MTSPTEGAENGDPAAAYARRLLRDLACERPIDGRPDAPGAALEWARSGAMALTGEAGGPPGFASGALATAARGAGLALATLAARAELPGRAPASAAGADAAPPGPTALAALDAPALLGERAARFGLTRGGRISCGGSARLLPLADGGIALNLPRDDDWRLLEAWLECELPGIAASRDWSALERALRTRGSEPLVERGREIGLAVAPITRPHRSPAQSSGAASPPFFRLTTTTRCVGGDRPDPLRRRRLRVLDLSTLWAGPLAGSLLLAAGSEVLKLESPLRPDGARAGDADFFALMNGGKRGCALDLAASRDREVFTALLDCADVVLESARPRALAQLGFDARAWVTARPGRIWASITGYGREHEWIAFGDDAAVAAGLAYDPPPAPPAIAMSETSTARMSAPPTATQGTPRFCGDAIADPLTGLHTAVAILALASQGRGGLLDLALADVAAHAAAAPAGGPLSLPRARHDGGEAVWNGTTWERVAPARARRPTARAPALAPPDAALLARWGHGC